jgi:hypothetical protein
MRPAAFWAVFIAADYLLNYCNGLLDVVLPSNMIPLELRADTYVTLVF